MNEKCICTSNIKIKIYLEIFISSIKKDFELNYFMYFRNLRHSLLFLYKEISNGSIVYFLRRPSLHSINNKNKESLITSNPRYLTEILPTRRKTINN